MNRTRNKTQDYPWTGICQDEYLGMVCLRREGHGGAHAEYGVASWSDRDVINLLSEENESLHRNLMNLADQLEGNK